jgi:hypothetical protein
MEGPPDKEIASHADLIHPAIAPWTFMPTGVFLVDGRSPDAHIGEVVFKDDGLVTGPAIQAGQWAFCLVRPRKDNTTTWVLAGFRGNALHFFKEVKTAAEEDPRPQFCIDVVNEFWPILFPGNHGLEQGKPFHISHKTTFVDSSEIRTMLHFSLRGGLHKPTPRDLMPEATRASHARLVVLLDHLSFDTLTVARRGQFDRSCICRVGGHRQENPASDIEVDVPCLEIDALGAISVLDAQETRYDFGQDAERAAAFLIEQWTTANTVADS